MKKGYKNMDLEKKIAEMVHKLPREKQEVVYVFLRALRHDRK
jgi:hypothetical protein